jgi:hypothetical protein
MIDSRVTKGTWRFKSEIDSRWNCTGEFARWNSRDDAQEVLSQYNYLRAFSEPPSDLEITYTATDYVD